MRKVSYLNHDKLICIFILFLGKKLNLKSFFTLTNKYTFFLILFFTVTILTGINNYYFYQHVERSSSKNLDQISTQLNSYYNYCKNKNIAIEECAGSLILISKSFSINAYYNDTFVIKNNEKIVWEKPTKDWDKIVKSDLIFHIPYSYEVNKLKIDQQTSFNHNLFLVSIIRSMTFSIAEFIEDINKKHYSYADGLFKISDKKQKNIRFEIDNKEFELSKHSNFFINDQEEVQKGDLIATGNIHVAIDKFLNTYWYRSRPALGYFLFCLAILYLIRKREIQIAQKQIEEDQKILEGAKAHPLTNDISDLTNKLKKYDYILNPPVNTIQTDTLFENDLEEIGTKFRKVTEKIIFQLYSHYIGELYPGLSLSTAIYELHKKKST